MKIINNRNNLLNYFPKNLKIAELGVFTGEYSEILLNTLFPSEFFLVDTFPSSMCSGDKDGNNIITINLESYYYKLVEKYKNQSNIKVIKSTTYDFLNSINDNYLDLVYIDADHSYESVRSDLELSFRKVKKDGFIMGHDYSERMFPEVVKAVNEFCIKYKLKINYLTNDGCPTFCILLENKEIV